MNQPKEWTFFGGDDILSLELLFKKTWLERKNERMWESKIGNLKIMVRFCQFCNRRLDFRSVKEQDEHEFGCIGWITESVFSNSNDNIYSKTQSSLQSINLPPDSFNSPSLPSANSSREKTPEPSPTKLTKKLSDRKKKRSSNEASSAARQCHICRKDIKGSLEQRQAHIMKCTNKAKVQNTLFYLFPMTF